MSVSREQIRYGESKRLVGVQIQNLKSSLKSLEHSKYKSFDLAHSSKHMAHSCVTKVPLYIN